MSTTSSMRAQSTSDKSTDSHRSNDNSVTNLVAPKNKCTPCGVQLLSPCFQFKSKQTKLNCHRGLVLLVTFIAYAAFHMCRRPFTIVKNEFSPKESSDISQQNGTGVLNNLPTHDEFVETQTPAIELIVDHAAETQLVIQPGDNSTISWAPFDDKKTVKSLFSLLDTAFLLSYAISMFFSGYIAERTNLRYLSTFSSVMSGMGLIAFGLAHKFKIHSLKYFLSLQVFCGAFQSIAWPVVVTCVGNWFDKSKCGLVFGIWNSHTSLGNILGALIAGYFVMKDWALSFIVPGAIMIFVGLILFLFLVPEPKDVDLTLDLECYATISGDNPRGEHLEGQKTSKACGKQDITEPAKVKKSHPNQMCGKKSIDDTSNRHHTDKAVSFLEALMIPGVVEYSLCLFFSKLVIYTFLFWLPVYIKQSSTFNSEDSAYLSIALEVGGISGAIVAGYLSDLLQANGIVCNAMLLLAIPSMFAFEKFGSISIVHNITLQLLVGMLVNGPYCLITTSVSADLGNRIESGRAMATVTAIIDGMGSLGAVFGPLLAGLTSTHDWNYVFIMLMSSTLLASICIARITFRDVKTKFAGSSSGFLVINA